MSLSSCLEAFSQQQKSLNFEYYFNDIKIKDTSGKLAIAFWIKDHQILPSDSCNLDALDSLNSFGVVVLGKVAIYPAVPKQLLTNHVKIEVRMYEVHSLKKATEKEKKKLEFNKEFSKKAWRNIYITPDGKNSFVLRRKRLKHEYLISVDFYIFSHGEIRQGLIGYTYFVN